MIEQSAYIIVDTYSKELTFFGGDRVSEDQWVTHFHQATSFKDESNAEIWEDELRKQPFTGKRHLEVIKIKVVFREDLVNTLKETI